ncbi:MAG TPA: c-type cytochrome [Candidatus Rubrimentiphilum sp.]|nr:c-type cytochrome [Candidatus Rubrimentiphilum sp.]
MTFRQFILGLSAIAGVTMSTLPVITGDKDIAIQPHHLDHAVLMLLGAIAGLAISVPRSEREAAPWLWAAILCPPAAMLLMSPSFYAVVDRSPWLHVFDHLVFFGLGLVTAYAGQRYVRGVGVATAVMLETMAIVAAFGYGVAPAAANLRVPGAPPQAALAGDTTRGKTLFAQNCAACHGASGQGGMGPTLTNEGSRKNLAETEAWIKKPAPPMPALYPNPLSAKDVADVAAFVQLLK